MPSTASEPTTDSSNVGGIALAVYLLVVYIAFRIMDNIGYQDRAVGALIIGVGVLAWGVGIVGVVQNRTWGVSGTLLLAGLTTLVLLTGGNIWLTVVLWLGVLAAIAKSGSSETVNERLA